MQTGRYQTFGAPSSRGKFVSFLDVEWNWNRALKRVT